LDPKTVDNVIAFAKERGLTPEQAQGILDRESLNRTSYADAVKQEAESVKKTWTDTALKDPEIGGTPEKLKESAELSKRVLQRYATQEFVKTLETTGFGNHPELVRVFARIGKEMREDQFVAPEGVVTPEVDKASRLFPSHAAKPA
jgi:hypothetical protein